MLGRGRKGAGGSERSIGAGSLSFDRTHTNRTASYCGETFSPTLFAPTTAVCVNAFDYLSNVEQKDISVFGRIRDCCEVSGLVAGRSIDLPKLSLLITGED